jgi:hypothetical protein
MNGHKHEKRRFLHKCHKGKKNIKLINALLNERMNES